MQIVIEIHDIPTNNHERWILKYGIPLPKTHGDLVDRNGLLKQYGLENATKYGNKDAEQQRHSYSTMMMYEIADMIEDAETIIPATKEKKHCKACKYSDNGMINVESERCRTCYYDGRLGGNCLFVPKQTATKEEIDMKLIYDTAWERGFTLNEAPNGTYQLMNVDEVFDFSSLEELREYLGI